MIPEETATEYAYRVRKRVDERERERKREREGGNKRGCSKLNRNKRGRFGVGYENEV